MHIKLAIMCVLITFVWKYHLCTQMCINVLQYDCFIAALQQEGDLLESGAEKGRSELFAAVICLFLPPTNDLTFHRLRLPKRCLNAGCSLICKADLLSTSWLRPHTISLPTAAQRTAKARSRRLPALINQVSLKKGERKRATWCQQQALSVTPGGLMDSLSGLGCLHYSVATLSLSTPQQPRDIWHLLRSKLSHNFSPVVSHRGEARRESRSRFQLIRFAIWTKRKLLTRL